MNDLVTDGETRESIKYTAALCPDSISDVRRIQQPHNTRRIQCVAWCQGASISSDLSADTSRYAL